MIVEEFWIINWDGLPLFKYSSTRSLRIELIGGFLSAIQSFAKTVIDDGKGKYLNTISIGDHTYNFMTNEIYKLYFILKTSSKEKEKIINIYLRRFEDMFIEEFRRDLITFDGDISKFDKFDKKFIKTYDRIASIDSIKSAVADESMLSKYKDRVISNHLSPKQAVIHPAEFLRGKSTKDKLKFIAKILPKQLSTILNVKVSYKTIKNNPENPDNKASKGFIKEFEDYAYSLGVGKIGYTKITPNLVYKNATVLFPNAIVLMLEMDEAIIMKSPSFETYKMIMGTYKKLNKVTNKLTKFFRENNYGAQAGPSLGGVANYVVLARNAGLGWIGRLGLLITPEFGPRQRLSIIATSIENLPFNADPENPHSWIKDFCQKCGECIKGCPGKAILKQPLIKDTGHTHIDNSKCFPQFYKENACTLYA
ncbi:hypothetical protein LCGC14_0998330 [marine sediment metagenome]|uniref:4Fe-4S ferredoxin-type domain-containing protein n=1 Tax=marine sediment metagenome TaxID=412755 RepID=A0A0F9NQA8_9ZZZZ